LKKATAFRKAAAACLLGLFALFTLTTLLNNYSNARLELAMDRQQARLMRYLTTANGPDPVLANFDANSTLFSHALDLFQIVGRRPDFDLQPFRFQTASPGASPLSYSLVTVQVKNKPLFVVRSQGDSQKVNASLQGFLSPADDTLFDSREAFRLVTFNLIDLVCPVVHGGYLQDLYCSHGLPVVDTRQYSYGWTVYHVTSRIETLDLPAVFQPDGTWKFQLADGTVRTLAFGQAGDKPVAGNWTGDWLDRGTTGIGVFDPATLTWSLDYNLDGKADSTFQLRGMTAADIPIAGDWNCSGRDFPGFFRPSDGSWHFWTANYSGPENQPVLSGTEAGVVPLVGDWNGNLCDTLGVYRPARGEVNLENTLTADLAGADFYAPKDARPVPGNWSGTGIETLAFFDAGRWTRLFANCDCAPANPAAVLEFGAAGDVPLAGKWPVGR
jgi:hypothetical protein